MPRGDVEITWRETQGFVSGYKDHHIVGTNIRYGKCTRRGALLAGAPPEKCNSTRDLRVGGHRWTRNVRE